MCLGKTNKNAHRQIEQEKASSVLYSLVSEKTFFWSQNLAHFSNPKPVITQPTTTCQQSSQITKLSKKFFLKKYPQIDTTNPCRLQSMAPSLCTTLQKNFFAAKISSIFIQGYLSKASIERYDAAFQKKLWVVLSLKGIAPKVISIEQCF